MKNYFLKLSFLFFAIIFTLPLACSDLPSVCYKEPQWIWYPGDFSIRLHQEVGIRRQERNEVYPPFWHIDTHNPVVIFRKKYNIEKGEQASLHCDGLCQVRIDGKLMYNIDKKNFTIPAGEHTIQIQVANNDHVPSIWLKSESFVSDNTWLVSNQDKSWYPAAMDKFTNPQLPPSTFKLTTEKMNAVSIEETKNGLLVDFGKETFGFPVLEKCLGNGKVGLFYGESREEAIAGKQAETYEYLNINTSKPENYTMLTSRAFRYINIKIPKSVSISKISMLYEYLPVKYRGGFRCSDELINDIYDVSYYTLHLTTREFHLDGIKRDRWIWSGDAYQSYLMNFYTFFDEAVNKRTIHALRGQDPVKTHINTILDYSFYWIIGIYDHFLYTGDTSFVKEIYPKMEGLIDFCISRSNNNGMVEGLKDDWVFIDWAPISKKGELCFEQILFARSLEVMAKCAEVNGEPQDSKKYLSLYKALAEKIDTIFWDTTQKAYIHGRKDGKLIKKIYKYPNMFSILFNYASEEQKSSIKKNVLLNNNILEITTPYMKFYELAALCEIGEHEAVTKFVKAYWGGMLELGATSFWETFNPEEEKSQHYAMYGRPFGKSLCHAWGANPLYLFGKYYLGVKPTAPGYKEFVIRPNLGGMNWIEGKVPVLGGEIEIKMTTDKIEVSSPISGGMLILESGIDPKSYQGKWIKAKKGEWYLKLEKDVDYVVRY